MASVFSSSQWFFANAHASEFHVLFVRVVLACALSVNVQRYEWCQLIVQAVFSHLFPPSFHCLCSVTGACFPFLCGGSWLGCYD